MHTNTKGMEWRLEGQFGLKGICESDMVLL